MSFDAVILTGGTGARLGGAAKADVEIGGATLLERALSATEDAEITVCVGPEIPASRAVVWTREDPAGGGPVAAIAAGLARVASEVAVVLAVDHPFVTRDHVRLLASRAAPAAWVVDDEGRAQPLVAAYRTDELRRRLHEIGDPASVPMRRLVEGLMAETLRDALAARDCDTSEDVEWASRLARGDG